MKCSPEIDKIAAALLEVQRAMPAVPKSGTNPHFSSKFIPLDVLLDHALPVCNEHGIFLTQGEVNADASGFVLETTAIHGLSGQWISQGVWFPIPKDAHRDKATGEVWYSDPTPNGKAIATTYSRRIGGCSFFSVAGEEDTDGAGTDVVVEAKQRAETYKATATKPATPRPATTTSSVGGIPKSCPNCGGKVWDNTEKKASGQFKASSPDWSCADSECKKLPGSVGWPEKHDVSAGIAKMKAALDMSRPIKGAKPKAPDFGPDFEEVPLPDEPPDFDL